MADELDPRNPNEEMGRTNEEDVASKADDEEFEDIDEADDEEEQAMEDIE